MDPFATTSSVHQGCAAVPILFSVAADFWMNRAVKRCPNLGTYDGYKLQDLDYADNVVPTSW